MACQVHIAENIWPWVSYSCFTLSTNYCTLPDHVFLLWTTSAVPSKRAQETDVYSIFIGNSVMKRGIWENDSIALVIFMSSHAGVQLVFMLVTRGWNIFENLIARQMIWLLGDGLVFFVPYSGSQLQLVCTAFILACTVCLKHLQAQHQIVAERNKLKRERLLQLTSHVDLNVFGSG
jgi:hypothetical protein